MAIKMVALDMDGTTLNDEKQITPYSRQVLEEAMAQGVIILACTGRPANGIPQVFASLKGIQYAISSNGARIVDVLHNQTLHEQLIDVEEAKRIMELASKYNTYREVFWDGVGYTTTTMYKQVTDYLTEYMREYIGKTRVMVDDLDLEIQGREDSCDKIHIVFADLEERKQAIAELQALGNYEFHGALLNNMEITAANTSKGTSIIKLGELLGIKRDEIMAIGDGMNDASMLQEVGLPVAMENAVPELKRYAKYITASNNEDGVAKAVEKFVLNKESEIDKWN